MDLNLCQMVWKIYLKDPHFLWLHQARLHWKRLWPGILFSMVLWVLLATAMSVYVSNSPNYALTYGALAGVVVTLLFFFLTGVSIILGGEVNAVVNFGVPPIEEKT